MDPQIPSEMRVLHIIDSSGFWGAERVLLELAVQHRDAGIGVTVLSIGKPSDGRKEIESAMAQAGVPCLPYRAMYIPSPFDLKRLLALIRRVNPDVIHSHGYKGNVLVGVVLRRWIDVPFITTVHGWTSIPGEISKRRFYEMLDILALRKSTAFVIVSESMRGDRRIKRVLNSSGVGRLHVIENGISRNEPPESVQIPAQVEAFLSRGLVIGSVGRISKEKGYDILIEAFHALSRRDNRLKLLLIGDGPMRPSLDQRLAELGLQSKVLITGYIHEASRLMSRLAIYVCASLTEGFPLSILEAMRAKVPIVATRVGSIPKMLQEGLGGGLVAAGDPVALEKAIQEALTDRPSTIDRVAFSSQEFLAKYSSDAMSARYKELYMNLARCGAVL